MAVLSNPEDVVADKFCRLSTKDPKTKQECVDIFKQLAEKNPESMMLKLVEMTGLSIDELTAIMMKSCPGCPD